MFHPHGPTFFELAWQALSSTQRGYDLLAPKFDYTPFRTPDQLIEAVAPHIGDARSIDSALDVCCGTGAAMRMLRPLCRERVVGIDFSHNMMEVARRQTADVPGEAAIEFVMGNALSMPFDEEFDLAVCFGALGHVLPRDQVRFVDQVAKVLRPGGRFVFVTSHMPSICSLGYWLARGFNALMHVRNFVVQPPFVMFYLTFLVPEAIKLLEDRAFAVEVIDGTFPKSYERVSLVIATRQAPSLSTRHT